LAYQILEKKNVRRVIIKFAHLIHRDIRRVYQKTTPEKPDLDYRKLFSSPRFIVDKLLKIFLFPLLILTIFFIKRDAKWFNSIEENQCADVVTYQRLDNYAEKLESTIMYELNNLLGAVSIYSAEIVFWFLLFLAETIHAIFVVVVSPKRNKVYVKIIHHRDGKEEEIPFEFDKLKDSGVPSLSETGGLHKRKNSANQDEESQS
jgi:hypothetical protein